MAALPVVAVVLIVLPQSFTDRARVWAGPVFVPFQNLTQGGTLDLRAASTALKTPWPRPPSDWPNTTGGCTTWRTCARPSTAFRAAWFPANCWLRKWAADGQAAC